MSSSLYVWLEIREIDRAAVTPRPPGRSKKKSSFFFFVIRTRNILERNARLAEIQTKKWGFQTSRAVILRITFVFCFRSIPRRCLSLSRSVHACRRTVNRLARSHVLRHKSCAVRGFIENTILSIILPTTQRGNKTFFFLSLAAFSRDTITIYAVFRAKRSNENINETLSKVLLHRHKRHTTSRLKIKRINHVVFDARTWSVFDKLRKPTVIM